MNYTAMSALHFCRAWGRITCIIAILLPVLLLAKPAKKGSALDDELIAALKQGKTQPVLDLLAKGANPKVLVDAEKKYTALHLAAEKSYVAISKELLARGANPNVHDSLGDTPLHLAASKGNETIVEALLGAQADPNAFRAHKATPLHWAASSGYPAIIKLLVAAGSNIEAIGAWQQGTPLHMAAEGDQPEAARTLLELGANPDASDDNIMTPLHVTAHRRHPKVAKVLLEHKANPNARMSNGTTPLHWAAEQGSLEISTMLVDHGADPNAPDNGGTPVIGYAVSKGHLNIVRYLMTKQANLRYLTPRRENALHDVGTAGSIQGKNEMIRFLLDQGVPPDLKSREKETPLSLAARGGNIDMVRMLLERNVRVDVLTDKNRTPLMYAVRMSYPSVIAELLKAGADPTLIDSEGKTPLEMIYDGDPRGPEIKELLLRYISEREHSAKGRISVFLAAVKSGQMQAVQKILLEKSIDPNVQDRLGNSALHYAVHLGYFEIANALLAAKAKPDLENAQGETPLFLAVLADETIAEKAVTWCLAHGANPKHENGNGQTAQDLAKDLELTSLLPLLAKK